MSPGTGARLSKTGGKTKPATLQEAPAQSKGMLQMYVSRTSQVVGQTRRNGSRAVARAFVGAKLWLEKPAEFPAQGTQQEACEIAGSNTMYLWAAGILLEHGDAELIRAVVERRVPLLKAATSVQKRVRLARAWRDATPEDLASFGRAVGVDRIFDGAVAPSL